MAARGGRERSAAQASNSSAKIDADLLLHPELLSQEFLLLTLEQKNVPVEDEVKSNKDGLADLYVQHVIPLPQRNLPKSRWGKLMEEKRSQQMLKHDFKSVVSVESLRKRPLIVFDGSSTSTSIKVRKTENGTINSLKLLATGNNSSICRRLHVPSDSSTCISPSALLQDIKVESRINEAKQNNIIFNNITSNQKSPPLVSVTGATVVKLKRAAPKEESGATNGLKPTEAKKKIQHVTWP